MPGRRRLGPRLVVACLCLLGVANVRMVPPVFCRNTQPPADYPPPEFIPRFKPLAEWLPGTTAAGYLLDSEHIDARPYPAVGRLYLAQYTLSPRLIEPTVACPLVIVDSDRPETPPKIARARGWTLVADLHNGVRLYRTRGERP